jgi:hypothetical protein
MPALLGDLLPDDGDVTSDSLLGRFLDYTADKGLSLYPAQEEAILELLEDKNVILNTPTGSGKSLVASAMLFAALARGAASSGRTSSGSPRATRASIATRRSCAARPRCWRTSRFARGATPTSITS